MAGLFDDLPDATPAQGTGQPTGQPKGLFDDLPDTKPQGTDWAHPLQSFNRGLSNAVGLQDIGQDVQNFASGAKQGAGSAIFQDLPDSLQGKALAKAPARQDDPNAAPLSLGDFRTGAAAGKLGFQLGNSAPVTTAGVLAGAAGSAVAGGPETPLGAGVGLATGATAAGAMQFAQTVGPYFRQELTQTPTDPDGAYTRAMERAGQSGAFGAAGWGLFAFKPLAGPAKQLLFDAAGIGADTVANAASRATAEKVGNLAGQALVVQPGVSEAENTLGNVQSGKPAFEGAGQTYLGGVAGNVLPLAGFEAGHAAWSHVTGNVAHETNQPGSQVPQAFADLPDATPLAHKVEQAASQVASPTDAQKESGNYAKGHVNIQGLPITIETPRGGERSGVGPDGEPWSVTMPDHYGYIKKTEGADGDHVDTYIGPQPDNKIAHVVDQVDADTGKFDEHKIMLGYPDQASALAAYDQAFSDGRAQDRIGGISEMPVSNLKDWLNNGDTTKPLAGTETAASGQRSAMVSRLHDTAATVAQPISDAPNAPKAAYISDVFDAMNAQGVLGSRVGPPGRERIQGRALRTPAPDEPGNTEPLAAVGSWWPFRSSDKQPSVPAGASIGLIDGRPSVVYHSTRSSYDPADMRYDTGIAKGVFASPDRDFSGNFGQFTHAMQIQPGNYFDFRNPDHLSILDENSLWPKAVPDARRVFMNNVRSGLWSEMENGPVREAIQNAGFDGMWLAHTYNNFKNDKSHDTLLSWKPGSLTPIRDAMQPKSEEPLVTGEGQPMFASSVNTAGKAKLALAAGQVFKRPEREAAATHTQITDAADQLPTLPGTKIGTLDQITPIKGSNNVLARFRLTDGNYHTVSLPKKFLQSTRAMFIGSKAEGGGFIASTRLGDTSQLGRTLTGELWHELTHSKIANGDLWGDDLNRLIRHSKDLRVIAMDNRDYLSNIGDKEGAAKIAPGISLFDTYNDLYHKNPDFDHKITGESVAHMIELWKHGVLSDEQMAPVRDLLDQHFSERSNTSAVRGSRNTGLSDQPMAASGSSPRDLAARKADAEKQGFDTSTKFYHGTSESFDAFDKNKFGSATKANSARQGVWLVDSGRTASGYAEHAATDAKIRALDGQGTTFERLAHKAKTKAEADKWWQKQHDVALQMEVLDREGGSGQQVIPAYVRGNFKEHDAEGAEWADIGDNQINTLIREARANGYDGVKILNLSDDVGTYSRPATHVLVFDPKNIRSVNADFDPSKSNSSDLMAAASGKPPRLGKSMSDIDREQKANGRGVEKVIAGKGEVLPKEQHEPVDEYGQALKDSIQNAMKRYADLETKLADLADRGIKTLGPEDPMNLGIKSELEEIGQELVENVRLAGVPTDRFGEQPMAINSVNDVKRAFAKATPEQIAKYWNAILSPDTQGKAQRQEPGLQSLPKPTLPEPKPSLGQARDPQLDAFKKHLTDLAKSGDIKLIPAKIANGDADAVAKARRSAIVIDGKAVHRIVVPRERAEASSGPAPGFTRVYHGADTDDARALANQQGDLWVTRNPQYARDFRAGSKPNTVWHIDLPNNHPRLVEANGDIQNGIAPRDAFKIDQASARRAVLNPIGRQPSQPPAGASSKPLGGNGGGKGPTPPGEPPRGGNEPPDGGKFTPVPPMPKAAPGWRKTLDGYFKAYAKTFQPELISDKALDADPYFARYRSSNQNGKDSILHQMDSEIQGWERRPVAEQLEWDHKFETGQFRTGSSAEAKEGQRYKAMQDRTYQLEKDYGSKAAYREDYLYHWWKQDPDKVKAVFDDAARPGNLGPTWFQKARTIDLIEEGIKRGLEPVTVNPAKLFSMRLMAGIDMMTRMQLLRDLQGMGLATKAKGANIPNSHQWQPINAPDREQWLIAPDVQPLWKNAVDAKGLWADRGALGNTFRMWMAYKNATVPLKLALSAFHPLHVLHINMTNNMVRGWTQMSRGGDFTGGLKSIFSNPFYDRRGAQMRASWLVPEAQRTPEQRADVQAMTEGGFTPMMSKEMEIGGREAFQHALNNNQYLKAAPLALVRAVAKFQAPIFEHWIPILKAAAYAHEDAALAARRPDIYADETQRMAARRAIAKSVDNRFGEMNNGNVFWNRTLKDSSIGAFLSLGWNLGFAREFGGGLMEPLTRRIYQGTATRQTIREATNKSAYVFAYTMSAMAIAGLMTKAFTGQNPSGSDYIFPRVGGTNPDGSPRRLSTMFFTREVPMAAKHIEEKQSVAGGLGSMLWNKMMFQPLLEAYNNKDYFGHALYDENAPGWKQMVQIVTKNLKDIVDPITVSGAERSLETGGSWQKDVPLSLLGFGPAPSYASRTALQNRVAYLFHERVGGDKPYETGIPPKPSQGIVSDAWNTIKDTWGGGMTSEQDAAKAQAKGQWLLAKQNNDQAGMNAAVAYARAHGVGERAIKAFGVPSDVSMFKALPDADQESILSQASGEEFQHYLSLARPRVASQFRRNPQTVSPQQSTSP